MSKHPPMVKCPHCGNLNQADAENRRDTCVFCQGELSPVERPVRFVPQEVQLRLETVVIQAAVKWWKVVEFTSKEQQPTMNELAQFIVQLLKEK